MGDASAGPGPAVDIQDPLPESNWVYRRILVFILLACFIAAQFFVTRAMIRKGDINALMDFTHWNFSFAGLILILYMIAPSAEQIANIFAKLSFFKIPGMTSSTQIRSVAPSGAVAEARTDVGTGDTGQGADASVAPPSGPGLPGNAPDGLPWRKDGK